MQVFSILLALPAIGVDFAHEMGTRGDNIVPRCADLLRAAEVSWVEEGNDSLSNLHWGTPPRYNVLRMSLYAGGERGRFSGVLGVAAGDNRERGERTRGE